MASVAASCAQPPTYSRDFAGPFHSHDPLTHSCSATGRRQRHPEARVAGPGSQQAAEEGGQERHREQRPLPWEARRGLRRRRDHRPWGWRGGQSRSGCRRPADHVQDRVPQSLSSPDLLGSGFILINFLIS